MIEVLMIVLMYAQAVGRPLVGRQQSSHGACYEHDAVEMYVSVFSGNIFDSNGLRIVDLSFVP